MRCILDKEKLDVIQTGRGNCGEKHSVTTHTNLTGRFGEFGQHGGCSAAMKGEKTSERIRTPEKTRKNARFQKTVE